MGLTYRRIQVTQMQMREDLEQMRQAMVFVMGNLVLGQKVLVFCVNGRHRSGAWFEHFP